MGAINHPSVVAEQYASPQNLDNRISIHEKYSINKQGWLNWLFAQYALETGDCVLELGCGNGRQWAGHADELPENVQLILTDLSEGMVAAARDAVRHEDSIRFCRMDIQDIPLPDGSVDVVIANMMLYHIPDIHKALREVRRVLKDGGIFYAATFGADGPAAYVREILGIPAEGNGTFTLENGAAILNVHFSQVEKRLYHDALAITDTHDLIAYIRTLSWAALLNQFSEEQLYGALEARKENGILLIPKAYGLFVSQI